MGHIITHITAPKNCNRDEIVWQIMDEAEREGDGYSGPIHWHDDRIYDTREEAEEAIRRFDKGWYDDHAVLFRSYTNLEEPAPTKTESAAFERAKAARKKLEDYIDSHHIRNLNQQTVSCPQCGSRLATRWMGPNEGRRNWNRNDLDACPVCRHELRSLATMNHIHALEEKANEAQKKADEIKSERIKRWKKAQKKQAEVCWLIKYEYHC